MCCFSTICTSSFRQPSRSCHRTDCDTGRLIISQPFLPRVALSHIRSHSKRRSSWHRGDTRVFPAVDSASFPGKSQPIESAAPVGLTVRSTFDANGELVPVPRPPYWISTFGGAANAKSPSSPSHGCGTWSFRVLLVAPLLLSHRVSTSKSLVPFSLSHPP